MTRRRLLIGWHIAAIVGWMLQPSAQAAEIRGSAPLRYRRYLVPADRPKDWPKPNVAYLPIERAEFERLVEVANSLPPGHAKSLTTRTTRARYTASLDGTLLRGEARIDIAHSGDSPALMTLAPLGLFIEDMRWDTSPPKEVVAGVSSNGDSSIVVEQPGSLLIHWTLTGSRDANGMLVFPLDVPECAVASFGLDLPEGTMATLSAGVPSHQDADRGDQLPRDEPAESGAAESRQVSTPQVAGGSRPRWEFAIGGRSRLSLAVGPDEATSERERLTLLQESVSYRFSPGGLELVAQLTLDVHHEPLRRLRLELDRGLRLVGAQYAGEEVSWSEEIPPGERPATESRRVTLEFNEPLLGSGRRLTVTALAPLLAEREWELPRLRVGGVFWQEGVATLLVPAPLSLDELQPLGCRQSNVAPLRSGRTGDAIDLQMFSAEATAKVLLSWRKQTVQLATFTAVEISPDGLRGELRGRFQVNEGELFVLQGEVGEGWLIDSVTASPAAAVSSWNVEEADGKQSVVAHLRGPLSPQRPIELTVIGRHPAEVDQPLSSDTFSMVAFGGAALEAELLALRAAGAHQLRFEGMRPPRAPDLDSLPGSVEALIGESSSQDLIDGSSGRSEWSVILKRQRPRFEAQCRVVASLNEGRLSQEFIVRILPDDSRLDRLVLKFTAPVGALDWSTEPDLGPITAQLLAVEPAHVPPAPTQPGAGNVPTSASASSGQTWEVRLGRATDSPFALRAVRRGPQVGEKSRRTSATLVALPDALAQQGVLELRLDTASARVIAADRLTPAAVDESETAGEPRATLTTDDDAASWRYSYRYDPLIELGASLPPAATIDAGATAGRVPAIVWRMHVHSEYATSGQARHWAVCDVENLGARQCRLTLPDRCEFGAASVDGQPIALSEPSQTLDVPMAGRRRFLSVTLEFTSSGKPLGILAAVSPAWPEPEGPVMVRVWTVSLPPEYAPWHRGGDIEHDWMRRLFGPLARPRDRQPFHLIRRDAWLNLSDTSSDAPTRSRADEFLELLGSAFAKAPAKQPTWAFLLDAVEKSERAVHPALLIDALALAELGIEPACVASLGDRFAVGSAAAGDLRAGAVRLLLANGLALLVGPDELVLTSQARAGQETRQRLRAEPNICSWNGPDRSAGAVEIDDPRYLPWSRWRRSPSSPFRGQANDDFAHNGPAGANCYRMDVGQPNQNEKFVHTAAVESASWALGAMVAAIGLWLARRSRRAWLALAGGIAVAVIWLPTGISPMASAAWLGLLGSLVWRMTFIKPARPETSLSISGERPAPLAVTTTFSVALAWLFSANVAAGQTVDAPVESALQPAGDRTSPRQPPVYRVFVPIDADGEQTGHFQAPTAFLDELRHRADAATDRPRGYLVSDARYHCDLAYDDDTGRLEIAGFIARYQLHALAPNVHVPLALRRETTGLLADSATLDGLPIEPRWSTNGQALICDLMEPGSYQLELHLLPPTADLGEVTALDLPVPTEASAALEVSLPADLPGVAVFGARGATRRSADGRQLAVGLGPVSRLSLRWPQQSAPATPEAEVEELLWLNVRPGSVVLDARFNYRVTSGTLRQVEFLADRRLRYVPSGSATPGKVELLPGDSELPGSPQTIRIRLDEPISDHGSLHLSLLLTESSGVGNLRLPNFRAASARSTKRWLAVTVNPGLEYDIRNDGQLERLTPNDFAMAWGGERDLAALADALAYRLPATETDWNLATRPREPQTTVKETLSLSFDRDRVHVQYDGELMTTAGYVFQHRLRVPPGLEIELVSLSDAEGGADRVSRWSRDAQSIVSVFLSSPMTGSQRLELRGRLALVPGGAAALPVVALEACDPRATIEQVETLARAVDIYRQPAVSVTLAGMTGLEPADERPDKPSDDRWGRLVASFRAEREFAANVQVTPNVPRIKYAEQVTSLHYLDQAWLATVDLKFQLEAGQLDILRFDVPADWSKAIEVSTPATLELSDQPGKNRKQLVIRPLVPLEGDCRVTLRAPLRFAAGEPITSPDIVPLAMGEVRRFWVLPTHMGVQPVSWEPTRLVPDAAPQWFASSPAPGTATPADSKAASLPDGAPADHEQIIYRAVGEDPLAVLNVPRPTTDVAQVRLADIVLRWRRGEPCEAAAAFDLEPGGLAACPIRLAAGWKIVSLAVDGTSLAAGAIDDDAFQVPLRSNRLPQRIELALIGPPGDPITTPPAWPGDVPVEASLFTVLPPADWRLVPTAQVEVVDGATCARARLDATAALIDLSPEVLAITPLEELSQWYRPWAKRLLACEASWRGQSGAASDERSPAARPSSDRPQIAEAWRKAARKLGTLSILNSAARRRPVATSAWDLWLLEHAGESAIHCRAAGGGSVTPLRLVADRRQLVSQPVFVTVGIGLVLLVAIGLAGVPLASEGPSRWPQMLGVALGLAWWLWLAPSVLGWLIVGFSLFSAWRSAWKPSWA